MFTSKNKCKFCGWEAMPNFMRTDGSIVDNGWQQLLKHIDKHHPREAEVFVDDSFHHWDMGWWVNENGYRDISEI